MRTRTIIILALCAAALAAFGSGIGGAQDRKDAVPASRSAAPSGGMLGTLQRGEWECALPGDAGGEAYVVLPEEGFRIGNASSYRNASGNGIYLLRGTELVFTRGPKKDERFQVLGDNTLQKMNPDGTLSKLICTRLGSVG
ncbi:elongation factor P [Erythrobacter sp. sf7]|uniref:Elongation factor P n=1 Tax=Erythrobacter fulvus TaxID=2987523 RepID=A0ABT5JLZ7_9SPHN|nr:elongation factor P [Erythrobacter fulvus]MDC8753148.1 elongation factor P [Erythrobacter fulvus]